MTLFCVFFLLLKTQRSVIFGKTKNDMEEAGGRECEESRVQNQRSCRSNEMEGRWESDRGGDEVYAATFGNEEKTELKLD